MKKPAATGQSTARAAQQSVESSLLEWVREKLNVAPEAENLQVRNVKELFADGRALPILVNAIQPGKQPTRPFVMYFNNYLLFIIYYLLFIIYYGL